MNTARQSRNQILLVVVLVLVIESGKSRTKDENEDEDEKFARAAKTFMHSSTGRATRWDITLESTRTDEFHRSQSSLLCEPPRSRRLCVKFVADRPCFSSFISFRPPYSCASMSPRTDSQFSFRLRVLPAQDIRRILFE